MTSVRVKFDGYVDVPTQGWGDECRLDQIKKQAADEISHWNILIQKGVATPVPAPFIKMVVTDVVIPVGKAKR